MKSSIGIFVKFPFPGHVKTRLAKTLGKQFATGFYKLCAEHVFRETDNISRECQKYIFYADDHSTSDVQRWVGQKFHCLPQVNGDMGSRLKQAFRTMFAQGAKKAIVLASDVPDLAASMVNDGLCKLADHDIVLGPTHDGGYYLIGLNRLHDRLFDNIAWSTDKVFSQTMRAIDDLGWHTCVLPQLIDINTESDLNTWYRTVDFHSSRPIYEYVRQSNSGFPD
jgi:rSAM/selenodomain-associated transferase 1